VLVELLIDPFSEREKKNDNQQVDFDFDFPRRVGILFPVDQLPSHVPPIHTCFSIVMDVYTERCRALCGIVDDLPSPSSSEINRFQVGDTNGISDNRSFKLDHFLSTARSRKGKEVDRSGEYQTVKYPAVLSLTSTAQVEQLRLSERDFDNLGQIEDGQFGSVSPSPVIDS
jgi:hypothetical protein